MSAPVTIVSAVAEDVESIMPVMDTAFDPAFGEAWTRAQCLGILSLPDVWLTIAKTEEGKVVGFTLARVTIDDAELLLLAVQPAARGQGIGRALVERCAEDAAKRKAIFLMLEMRDGNPAGILYDHSGFTIVGRRKAYYRGNDGHLHDALTMRRTLGASFTAAAPLQSAKPSAST